MKTIGFNYLRDSHLNLKDRCLKLLCIGTTSLLSSLSLLCGHVGASPQPTPTPNDTIGKLVVAPNRVEICRVGRITKNSACMQPGGAYTGRGEISHVILGSSNWNNFVKAHPNMFPGGDVTTQDVGRDSSVTEKAGTSGYTLDKSYMCWDTVLGGSQCYSSYNFVSDGVNRGKNDVSDAPYDSLYLDEIIREVERYNPYKQEGVPGFIETRYGVGCEEVIMVNGAIAYADLNGDPALVVRAWNSCFNLGKGNRFQ